MNTENYITLNDSRTLCYAEYGDATGTPVIYFHGMPASRLEGLLMNQTARELGLRVIAPDRPGFGQSSFQPQRKIIGVIDDIRQLTDQLQLERFCVLGLSGGCPYTLACSWGLPERIIQAVVIAGLGEFSNSSYTNEMPTFARLTLHAAARFPQLIQAIYGTAVASLVKSHPALLQTLLGSHNCQPDRDVWSKPETAALFTAASQETFAQGGRGAAYELTLLCKPWGFRSEDIRIPVKLWHGAQDKTVPTSMSREQHARIPHSTLAILPEEGHFSLPVKHMERILSDIGNS